MKLRIVEEINNPSAEPPKSEFVIQRKFLGFWWEVKEVEVSAKRLTYHTYGSAENYMYKNYMPYGLCTKSGNVYVYSPYNHSL